MLRDFIIRLKLNPEQRDRILAIAAESTLSCSDNLKLCAIAERM